MDFISGELPRPLGKTEPLAQSLSSMSRAGTLGTAKNQASWALRHLRNQQGLGLYRMGSASLSTRVKRWPGLWKLLDRIDEFTEEVGQLGPADARLSRSVRRTKSLDKRLNSGLSEGSCWGTSTSVLQALERFPALLPSQARSIIPGDRIAVFQVLFDLRVRVDRRNEAREWLLDRVELLESNPGAVKALHESGLPPEIVDEWEVIGPDKMRARLRYGQALIQEINEMMVTMGGQELPQLVAGINMSLYFPDKVQLGTHQLSYMCMLFDRPVRVDCHPEEDGVGHSMVFDPKNARFYDENLGWYLYSSQEEAVNAFIEHVAACYPRLVSGHWSFSQMPPQALI